MANGCGRLVPFFLLLVFMLDTKITDNLFWQLCEILIITFSAHYTYRMLNGYMFFAWPLIVVSYINSIEIHLHDLGEKQLQYVGS